MSKLTKKTFKLIVPKSTRKALSLKKSKRKKASKLSPSTSTGQDGGGVVTTRQKVEMQKQREGEYEVETILFEDFLAQATTVSPPAPSSPQEEESQSPVVQQSPSVVVSKSEKRKSTPTLTSKQLQETGGSKGKKKGAGDKKSASTSRLKELITSCAPSSSGQRTKTKKKEPNLLEAVLWNKLNDANVNQCFETSVQVIYSPIASQLTDEVVNMDDYAYIGMKLSNTIRGAFPDVPCKQFESTWNNCFQTSFPDSESKKPVDYALLNLAVREKMVNDGKYRHFSKSNFNSKDEYKKWKQKELQMIAFLRERALSNRKHPFLFRINIESMQLMLDTERKDLAFKQEVFFKVRTSEEPDKELCSTPIGRVSRTKKGQLTLKVQSSNLPILDFTSEDRHIVIHVYRRGVLGNERFGEIQIPIQPLLQYFVPENCSWAIQPFSADYIVYHNEKNKPSTTVRIGTLFVSFYMQLHRAPPIMTTTSSSSSLSTLESSSTSNESTKRKYSQRQLEKYADTDYYLLFDILLHQFIQSNVGNELQRDDARLLNFYQTWIIEEYSNQHGISEVYKRISMLREIVSQNDLLLKFIQEFKDSFDFVVSNIKEKFVCTTKYECDLLKVLKQDLTEKLEAVIFKFLSEFDTGRSRVLKVAVDILEYISLKDDTMSKSDFSQRFEDIMIRALRKNYGSMLDNIHENTETEAQALIETVESVKEALYDILYYSDAVPSYCKWELRALKIFLNELNNDFDSLLQRKALSGYWILMYCQKMDELNDEIRENFDKQELKKEKIELFSVKENAEKYENVYVKELAETLKTYMTRSIALEKWERCNEEVLHSHSVVDFFTSAFQTLEYISNADFVTESLLDKYSLVVGESITSYAKQLEQLCQKEVSNLAETNLPYQQEHGKDTPVPKKKKRNIFKLRFKTTFLQSTHEHDVVDMMYVTPEFVVKLNNIEATKVQFQDWVKTLMEEKSLFRDTDIDSRVVDDDEDSDADEQSESNMDESIKNMKSVISTLSKILKNLQVLIVRQFQPFVRPAINKVLRMSREGIKKSHVKLPEAELRSIYGRQAQKLLNDLLLESVLTPNLAILSENIYEGAFTKILTGIYKEIMDECVQILAPPSAVHKKCSNCIDSAQEVILRHLVEHIDHYFYGDGEGLSHKTLNRNKRFFLQVFQLYSMDTERLINLCEKLKGVSSTHPDSITYDHVMAVISGRYYTDKVAKKYFKRVHAQ